jgi:hypothetical protein
MMEDIQDVPMQWYNHAERMLPEPVCREKSIFISILEDKTLDVQIGTTFPLLP